MTIQRVKGMQDVLPADREYWDAVTAAAARLARLYGFERMDLPIIEFTDLFERGAGTASDFFVQKEMYTFEDADGSISLRPEFTAGFVRAYIQNGLASWTQPVKLYTIGPSFRRERPQAGRYRQHSQFNAEIMGEIDPAADLEVMMLAMNLYRELGYQDLSFELNSTGCSICRPAYVEELSRFLRQHKDKLSDLDRERLARNPLRVLDSKEPGMEALLAAAPHTIDYLCDDCASHFSALTNLLDRLGQSYAINFRLVRGIDYYTKTVFEVWAEGIGAQAALCGGGRYDGLAEAIGGASTPGVGFGSGIERIVLGLKELGVSFEPDESAPVMIVHFGGDTKLAAVQMTYDLRAAGIGARLAFARERRSLKSQMREADRRRARYVAILGEDELARAEVAVRSLATGEQDQVPQAGLETWLAARLR